MQEPVVQIDVFLSGIWVVSEKLLHKSHVQTLCDSRHEKHLIIRLFQSLWALTVNALSPLVFSRASGTDKRPLPEDLSMGPIVLS